MRRLAFLECPAKNEVRRPLGLCRRLDDQLLVVFQPFEPFGDICRRIVNRPLTDLRLAAQHPAIQPTHLCFLVTQGPKTLLRLQEVGGLEPGQYADLLILRDIGGSHYEIFSSLQRNHIRAVIRDGRPAWADSDFADWFADCEIPTTRLRLDGREKLCATALLGSSGAAELEPGLEILC